LPYSIYFKLSPWLGHLSIQKYAFIEHLVVFAVFGALISFAFPDRIISICCIIVFSATLLELLQTLTPDRHGTIVDACQKITGGLLGALSGRGIARWICNHGRSS
jgi:apolipoprotein N-acyltransferase